MGVRQNFINSLLLVNRLSGRIIPAAILLEHVVHALQAKVVITPLISSCWDIVMVELLGGHLGGAILVLVGAVAGRVAAVQGALSLVHLLLRAWEVQLSGEQLLLVGLVIDGLSSVRVESIGPDLATTLQVLGARGAPLRQVDCGLGVVGDRGALGRVLLV